MSTAGSSGPTDVGRGAPGPGLRGAAGEQARPGPGVGFADDQQRVAVQERVLPRAKAARTVGDVVEPLRLLGLSVDCDDGDQAAGVGFGQAARRPSRGVGRGRNWMGWTWWQGRKESHCGDMGCSVKGRSSPGPVKPGADLPPGAPCASRGCQATSRRA